MQQTKHSILPNYSVSKSNAITAMRNIENITINQLKLFYIYLSRVNPRDMNTRTVRIPLKDYVYIMGNQYAIRPQQFIKLSEEMVKITTTIPIFDQNNNLEGFSTYPIFSTFSVRKSPTGQGWYVDIECHEKMLPHFFNLQSHYSSFKIWNMANIHCVPHLRLYDLLQQYKGLSKIYTIEELRELTGTKNKYTRWDNFKRKVLDEAQKIFNDKTDISFTYELISGYYNQITSIKFEIQKNPNAEENRKAVYDMFDFKEDIQSDELKKQFTQRHPAQLAISPFTQKLHEISEHKFTDNQMGVLEELIKQLVCPNYLELGMSQYFHQVDNYYYNRGIVWFKEYYKYTAEQNPKHFYQYMKKVISNQIKEIHGLEPPVFDD